jgi:transcriptional regulator GlxA family with amidase domain
VDGGRAGGRDIDHARVRQRVLQAQARAALLGGRDIAAFALAATGVLHGMALVENDHSVEVGA